MLAEATGEELGEALGPWALVEVVRANSASRLAVLA